MRVPGCGECQRLWEEYTDATFALVKLDTQVKMATLRYEPLEIMALLKEGVEAATHRRNAALARLKQHEATHQTRSSSRVLESKIPPAPCGWHTNQNLEPKSALLTGSTVLARLFA